MKNTIKIILLVLITVLPSFSQDMNIINELKKNKYEDPILKAIQNNNFNEVKKYIKAGVDINKEIAINISPKISQNKNVELTFPVNPLLLSVLLNNFQITKLLLKNNARIKDDYFLLSLSDVKIANLLIQNGADINSEDFNGKTCIHYSIIFGNNILFKLFLKHGANINQKDNDGRTCIHYSAIYGDDKLFLDLLKHGSDINQKDNKGWTTLGLARFYKKYSIVKIIESNKFYTNIDKIKQNKIKSKTISIDQDIYSKIDSKHPDNWLKGLRAGPYRLNGNVFGYRLIIIRPFNLLSEFGFKDGDILTKINDKIIDDGNIFLNFPSLLLHDKKINFEYIRSNKFYKLNVIINSK